MGKQSQYSTNFFYFRIFILTFIKENFTNNRKLIISIIFFSLACYTKQYYSFFLFSVNLSLNKIALKKFIFVLLFCILCAIPGIYYLILNPLLFFGIKQNITNFNSAILISGSIIFVYLIPFIIQKILNFQNYKKFRLIDLLDKKIFILSLIITLLCSLNFDYSGNVGGGILLKISYFLFDSQFLIFPFAFFGIYFLLYFSQNTISNYSLVILLLITFNTGYFVFQKYFEPMFYIIFLNFFDKSKIYQSIKNSNFVIIFYLVHIIFLQIIYIF